jgi:hypothetical protein
MVKLYSVTYIILNKLAMSLSIICKKKKISDENRQSFSHPLDVYILCTTTCIFNWIVRFSVMRIIGDILTKLCCALWRTLTYHATVIDHKLIHNEGQVDRILYWNQCIYWLYKCVRINISFILDVSSIIVSCALCRAKHFVDFQMEIQVKCQMLSLFICKYRRFF